MPALATAARGRPPHEFWSAWIRTKANCWLTTVLRMFLSRAASTTRKSTRTTEVSWRLASVVIILNAQRPRYSRNSKLFRRSNLLPRGEKAPPKRNKATVYAQGSRESYGSFRTLQGVTVQNVQTSPRG